MLKNEALDSGNLQVYSSNLSGTDGMEDYGGSPAT